MLQSVLCITTDKYLVRVLVVLLHARFSPNHYYNSMAQKKMAANTISIGPTRDPPVPKILVIWGRGGPHLTQRYGHPLSEMGTGGGGPHLT